MAKNLMKTSDKSNFILNMTEEKYSGIAGIGLMFACLSVSLFTIPPEVSTNSSYTSSSLGLSVAGVFCMILALIAIIRKFIDKKALLPACAFGIMIGWGTVSMLASTDINTGLYGFPQRGEGLLAIIFYSSFFITAASLKRQKALKAVINGIILAGLANSLIALLQVFVEKFKDFRPIAYRLHFAASGLSQSPIFLAMVLSLALIAASVTAVLDDSKKRRILCLICSCVFAFTLIYTFSLVSLAGIGIALIFSAAAVFIRKAPKKSLFLIAAPAASAALAFALCFTEIVPSDKEYKLNDGYTLWAADAFERASASGNYDKKSVDIYDTFDVYYHLNDRTLDIIKDSPMLGTGPEQLVYPQLYTVTDQYGNELETIADIFAVNPGTFDKVYNEYLYTTATRGIPSLIALLLILLPVLFIGFNNAKLSLSHDNAVLFLVTLGGALIFLIGCSNITFAPIFWTAAGASCVCLEKKKITKKP